MEWKGWHRIQFRTGTESTLAWTLTGTWALLQNGCLLRNSPRTGPLTLLSHHLYVLQLLA